MRLDAKNTITNEKLIPKWKYCEHKSAQLPKSVQSVIELTNQISN